MIAEPLTFLQCCPTSDGAGAVIVGAERGNADDLRIESSVMVSGALWDHRSDDVWGYASVARAAEKAFAQAGRAPAEIDVLEVHDAFTIGEILTCEALGLAPRGKGAELAPSGHTQRDGAQPVNPSGGLLSRGHPLGATGLAQLAEIAWQLRGRGRRGRSPGTGSGWWKPWAGVRPGWTAMPASSRSSRRTGDHYRNAEGDRLPRLWPTNSRSVEAPGAWSVPGPSLATAHSRVASATLAGPGG